jgi:hypothetical protein
MEPILSSPQKTYSILFFRWLLKRGRPCNIAKKAAAEVSDKKPIHFQLDVYQCMGERTTLALVSWSSFSCALSVWVFKNIKLLRAAPFSYLCCLFAPQRT